MHRAERLVAVNGGFSAAFTGAAVIAAGAALLSAYAIRVPAKQAGPAPQHAASSHA